MRKKIWIAISVSIAVVTVFSPVLHAAPWYQPDDINPGETYQIVFTTSTRITAESSDISIYRNHVNVAADLNPELGKITFSPIISTESTNARDEALVIGPVYNTNGDLVANDFDDMWDETLSAILRYDQNGIYASADYTTPQYVWSGTLSNGLKREGLTAGCDNVSYGKGDATNAQWIYTSYPYSGWSAPNDNQNMGLYALSDPITAVPISSAIWLFGTGLIGIVGIRRKLRQ